jgi:propionyl-CoA carboxylase alpha chain
MIAKLLVANRGEIASRIFRTCRLLGIGTVAVYAEPDVGLPFVREADVAVALGGMSATESYLDVGKILDAARRSGADAIHPGFGFLSENAAFAQAVIDAGFTWVGPTPANITAMGTKVEAKELAAVAGVPVLPSAVASGDESAEWARAAQTVGYPILVKASSGGGGRGMRIVMSPDELADAVVGARREAAASFGDATVFLERYLPAPRHIEIQVFGDTFGNVIHLGERECSIQRRHQKIVEEAPSPVLTDAMRNAMCTAAVGLAKAIAYVGAGTVEFLYDDADTTATPQFFFLEMNTRLQVEHPVTECLTGADLVRWQIDVANGLPLPLTQEQVETRGAAIEVRLYAEDPAQDFLPTFGHMHAYESGPSGAGIRFENGVESGSDISTAFDPMVAKVIAHAPTRTQAAAMLRRALAGLRLHGPVTNRDYLVAVLGSDDYLAGNTTTAFVVEHPELLGGTIDAATRDLHLVAATLVGSLQRRRCDRRWTFAPAGFRNLPSQPLRFRYHGAAGEATVGYMWSPFDPTRCSVTTMTGSSTSSESAVHIVAARCIDPHTDELTLESGGITCTLTVRVLEGRTWVNSVEGQTEWVEIDRFPSVSTADAAGGPIAPVPGRVVAVNVAVGQAVEAGDILVVMEAMKMEHRIEAGSAGVVGEILCAVGEQVDAHQVLVTITST